MRTSQQRAAAYSAKVRGAVLPGQVQAFRSSIVDRVALDHYINHLNIEPIRRTGYSIFGQQLLALKKKHAGVPLQNEACRLRTLWLSRNLEATLLDDIMVHFNLGPCVPPTPACAWSYYMSLTMSGNPSATDLVDFPVMVHLTAANFNFAHAQANGEDVRFLSDAECPSTATPLSHEIEKWDQAGQDAVLWVKVPLIPGGSVDAVVYLYHGNPAAADGQDVAGTWSNSYQAVHHMNSATATLTDVLANYDFTKKAAAQPSQQTGKMHKGQLFVKSTTDYANHLTLYDAGMPVAGAFEMWVKPTNTYTDPMAVTAILGKHNTGPPTNWLQFFWYINGVLYVTITKNGAAIDVPSTTTTWTGGTWYHLAVRFGTGGIKLYVNGVPEGSNASTDVMAAGFFGDFQLGRSYAGTQYSDITVDELRFHTSGRTDGWFKTVYVSENNALITYGAEAPA